MRQRLRQASKAIGRMPNLLQGYSIRVNPHKLRMIEDTFTRIRPGARSFVDCGGVWGVDAAYTFHTLKRFTIERGYLVDTDFTEIVTAKAREYPQLELVNDGFGEERVVEKIGRVDAVYFFDVLLHQVAPDWDEILKQYSRITDCFVIFNQQYIRGNETIRLLDLPYEEYVALAPKRPEHVYRTIYDKMNEIDPKFGKPYKDIHQVWQWGIVDSDLRKTLADLGYGEKFYQNYGQFSNLEAFEDHGFVFVKS